MEGDAIVGQNDLLRIAAKKVGSSQFVVYAMMLCTYFDEGEPEFLCVSTKDLHESCSLSENTVRSAFNELESAGLVKFSVSYQKGTRIAQILRSNFEVETQLHYVRTSFNVGFSPTEKEEHQPNPSPMEQTHVLNINPEFAGVKALECKISINLFLRSFLEDKWHSSNGVPLDIATEYWDAYRKLRHRASKGRPAYTVPTKIVKDYMTRWQKAHEMPHIMLGMLKTLDRGIDEKYTPNMLGSSDPVTGLIGKVIREFNHDYPKEIREIRMRLGIGPEARTSQNAPTATQDKR